MLCGDSLHFWLFPTLQKQQLKDMVCMLRTCEEATYCLAHPAVTLHNMEILILGLCLKPKLLYE